MTQSVVFGADVKVAESLTDTVPFRSMNEITGEQVSRCAVCMGKLHSKREPYSLKWKRSLGRKASTVIPSKCEIITSVVLFYVELTRLDYRLLHCDEQSKHDTYKKVCLLVYSTLQTVESQPVFQRNMTPPSSGSKNKPSKKPARKCRKQKNVYCLSVDYKVLYP
jgi:hypothetical protein